MSHAIECIHCGISDDVSKAVQLLIIQNDGHNWGLKIPCKSNVEKKVNKVKK